MSEVVSNFCEGCPLLEAYAQYEIQKDLGEEVNYQEIWSKLTIMDGRRLEALTDRNSLSALDSGSCNGPKRTLLGLGRKACTADFALRGNLREPII